MPGASEDATPDGAPERVVQATIRLLAEQGPSAIKARTVASASGLSTMAVYHHFGGIAGLGMIEPGEMYSTFNMGTGYVAVVPAESVDPVISAFAAHGHDTWEIGEVVAGERAVDLVG